MQIVRGSSRGDRYTLRGLCEAGWASGPPGAVAPKPLRVGVPASLAPTCASRLPFDAPVGATEQRKKTHLRRRSSRKADRRCHRFECARDEVQWTS